MIPYARQEITAEDIDAVVRALQAPMVTQGPLVDEFEAALAAAVGARYAVVVNSGTAALHAAYFAAGVGPGRDVLTTPITFAATANAACYLGGGVRFADVLSDSALLDPAALPRERDAASTGLLVPVHFGGQVADMARLAAAAEHHGWQVVEDAAHALGASYFVDGTEFLVGACAHSTMCCFSFHAVKHITTGEGGAVTTNDPQLRDRLRQFRTHGITRDESRIAQSDGPWYYEQQLLGYNYRLTDVQCALGISQLKRLKAIVERRRTIAAAYDRIFAGSADVQPLAVPPWSRGAYHLYVVLVPPSVRLRVFERLRASGIGVNVHYIPVYRLPYHRDRSGATQLPNAESYYERAITLPMFPGLTDAEVAHVGELVTSIVSECVRDGVDAPAGSR